MTMLEGKVALVTGASSGIGKSTALVMAAHGAKVVIAARREEESDEVVERIKSLGGSATFIKTDVTDEAQVEAMVGHVIQTYGQLDCAVNNSGAGFRSSGDWPDASTDGFDRTFDLNVRGVWLCMKYEIKQMLSQGSGAIVNTSSIVGLRAAGNETYASSKYAVIGLTTSAAAKYGKSGVRANAVAPGIIDAGVWKPTFEADREKLAGWNEAIPIGRIGRPEEVGEVIAWLCSDWSSYVTGVTIPVDGGNAFTINAP
ncbi:MAG: glucose 1-dehydrogenase [Chloroflexi bacterium]|nr:glucose 1-dehydrogenase [Chloroflexota bacterium]